MERDELERAGRGRADPLDLGDHGAAHSFGREPIERGRRAIDRRLEAAAA